MKLNTQYALDYERKSLFDVTFETTTDDTKSLDSFRIYVKDINEAPLVSHLTYVFKYPSYFGEFICF